MRSQGLWESLREAVLSAATHPSLFSLVTSLYAVSTWSEREEKVKWRSAKNWEDSEQYAHHKTIANQQWFPQHPNSWFATTWQGAMLGVRTTEFFLEEFSWKKSLVPRGAKLWISSRTIVNLISYTEHSRVFHLINSYDEIMAFKENSGCPSMSGHQMKNTLSCWVYNLKERDIFMV